MAAGLVFAGAFFDLIDGGVARLLKAQSAIGAQLDSLADAVTFGVLPGLIAYQLIPVSVMGEAASGYQPWMRGLAFLIPIAAIWRLAVFNTDASQAAGFRGLPTPANGLFWASLPLAIVFGCALDLFTVAPQHTAGGLDFRINWPGLEATQARALGQVAGLPLLVSNWTYVAAAVVLPVLMVVRLPLLSVKQWKAAEGRWVKAYCALAVVVSLVVGLWTKNVFLAIPILLLLYVLMSIGASISNRHNAVQS